MGLSFLILPGSSVYPITTLTLTETGADLHQTSVCAAQAQALRTGMPPFSVPHFSGIHRDSVFNQLKICGNSASL